jgi:hypothetical protein
MLVDESAVLELGTAVTGATRHVPQRSGKAWSVYIATAGAHDGARGKGLCAIVTRLMGVSGHAGSW